MSLLEVRGLRKTYGRRCVVDGVDLDVHAGEIVGLIGPNGAGKTTSFRMMVGMIPPQAGHIRFAGKDVTQLPMYRRARLGLGYLAQDASAFRKLTVEQNLFAILEMMTSCRGKPFRSNRRQRRNRVDELLDRFGLTKIRKSIAGNCSGGERRRLEIARCLLSEPMLIMLDEPFTGIDPITVSDIQVIARELCDQGIAVLITDHHVEKLLKITDRIYLIADGKMLTHGTPLELINDPRARKSYLGDDFDVGLSSPAPTNPGAVRSLLDKEEVLQLVDRLAGDDHDIVAGRIRARGNQAIEPLIQALDRSDPILRERAYSLLCEIFGVHFEYDPTADELTRRRQSALLRQRIQPPQAG